MKKFAGPTLFAMALLLCGVAFSQDPPPPESSEKKIERLEKELVATRERVESVALKLAQTQELLDATIRYLNLQAEGAKDVSTALDASETAGFVYGINPRSREILLAAWRDQLSKVLAGLPEVRPAPEPPKPPELEKGRRPLPPRR